MGFWSSLLKYGGSAAKGVGKFTAATGKSMGGAVLHPTQTLRSAGNAVKTATVGAAVGYVGWEKLTTDKSVVRIVSDAVVGENATDAIGNTIGATTEKVQDLTERAGEAIDDVKRTTNSLSSSFDGISNFLSGVSGGNAGNMFGNFISNLVRGNVSGMSIVGLVAAAFLVFGRFGWLGKITGALLSMMLIGNNIGRPQEASAPHVRRQAEEEQPEERTHSGGMRR